MKIVKEAWETRYEELVIQLKCKDCGTQFEAEGKDDDFKVVTRDRYFDGIIVHCPHCQKAIDATICIRNIDSELVSFIANKKSQNPQT